MVNKYSKQFFAANGRKGGKKGGQTNAKKGSKYFIRMNKIRWDRYRAEQLSTGVVEKKAE